MDIKNVIFDVGGVILYFSEEEFLNNFTNDNEEKKLIIDYIYNSPEWMINGLIDLGVVSQEEFVKIIQDRTNHTHDELVRDVILNYYKVFHVQEKVKDLIKSLKENGYNVYILSNINEYVHVRTGLDEVFKYTDGQILSYKYCQIKPFTGIYQTLLNRFNLKPEECLFIDDREVNLKTANKLGIKGEAVKTNNIESIKDLLNKYNIKY